MTTKKVKTAWRKPRTKLPERSPKLHFDSKPGLPAAINRLRIAEIQAAEDYKLAVGTDDADLIARKKRDWVDLVEQLRKVESSNPEIERANAQTLPITEVETECARMVTAFRVSMESLPRSLPQKLVGQDAIGIQEILSKSIRDALRQLHSGKWRMSNDEPTD